MLASWSRAVTTISSPASSVRATGVSEQEVRVVMFAPKAMPSTFATGETGRSLAAAGP